MGRRSDDLELENMSPEERLLEERHKRMTEHATTRATLRATMVLLPLVSTVLACLAWAIQPRIVALMAVAVAPTVEAQIGEKIAPLSASFRVLLEQQISDIQKEITALEYKQQEARRRGNIDWTLENAQDLADARKRLQTTQAALNAIDQTR